MNARYYDPKLGQFLSQDPVFLELGVSKEGKQALFDPQSMNSYSYAGNNPIKNSDPDGRWYKEFFWDNIRTGGNGQSWNSFYGEVGEAANYLGQSSPAWNYAMNNPYTTGAAVGVAGGVVAYGTAAIITQAQVGMNLGRLSELPMNSRVDTVPKYGFDAIKNATGLTKNEAIQIIQSSGRSLLDLRNGGNINNIANVGEKVIRITTTPNASKIISAGVINGASKISQYISSGAMRAIPTVTSVAKTVTQFIRNLAK